MGGHPDWIDVTDLEIVATGADPGSAKQDVVEIGPGADPARNAFDLIASFKAVETNIFWWGSEEQTSDDFGPFSAEAVFYAESIGPGIEPELGTATVDLTLGGDPGGGPLNTSLYEVQLQVADASTKFVDALGVLQPGVYRIQCRVDFERGLSFATTFYDGDLIVRVAERP